tara:strand:- start:239 stop:1657 length:1419 start_codon:yes stop_codon:yes gene_type:complete
MRFYCFIFSLFFSFPLFAQDSTVTYTAEISVAAASGTTPFWMQSNQNGTIPDNGNFISGKWGVSKIYHPHNPRQIQWSGQVELITNQMQKTAIFLSNAYLALSYKKLELAIGQRNRRTGILDSTLSMGSMTVSQNARSSPGIQLSSREYVTIPGTNQFLSFKASYSESMLRGSDLLIGPAQMVHRTYLHQKTLYLKWGNPSNNLRLWTGINHQVIWGGEAEIFPIYKDSPLPVYRKIVFGQKRDGKLIGNHFGSYDVGISIPLTNWSMLVYKQSLFDNGSLFKVRNFQDGLIGVSLKNKNNTLQDKKFRFSTLLFEFISSKNQRNSFNNQVSIVDNLGNYYNGYIYQNGWSYLGKNIGSPMIPSQSSTNPDLPRNNSQFSNNNRIEGFHLGAHFTMEQLFFTVKSTYSHNLGTYIAPFESKKSQASIYLKVEKMLETLGGFSTFLIISSDIGGLYPNSNGALIGISKKGFLD